METKQINETKQLLDFIEQSPTAFHAVKSISAILEENGFQHLNEGEKWELASGKGYYLTRNQSSIIAFRIPSTVPHGFMIAASHTDSPMFKLKNNCETLACNQYIKLNTEPYGGTIFSSWLDRPLTLAGRVILSENGNFLAKTVEFDENMLLIPNVAIHQNRGMNNGYAYNPAVDLSPLFAQKASKDAPVNGLIRDLLAKKLDCKPEQIVGMDLYVVSNTKGCIWGVDDAFFSAPRIDNLMCAFGTLAGFVNNPEPQAVTVYYAADNEETGSATKQGAASVFLSDTLDRVCESFGWDKRAMLASSMMVSADNGHARHPNHPELSDADNSPRLNGGVVIKCNAAQKYTTDGISAALFTAFCNRAGVPVQQFANRSDLPGGSTLGSISNTTVPLITVDIGMAQLAMHSAYETAGSADTSHLIKAMTAFFGGAILAEGDGSYRLAD